ncbi:MAG: hypothetical protein IPQ13_15110 [Holophagaceae bacterium]|nr:hypothetical protein [Holophagaceae bacterium]
MNPHPPTSLVTARLLAAWAPLEPPAWILLLAALVLLWLHPAPLPTGMGAASLLAGVCGLYLGWRIRFDAAIFLDLAEARITNGESFDAAIKEMGLPGGPARSEAERCRGALRLLYQRIFWFLIQVAALAVGVWTR